MSKPAIVAVDAMAQVPRFGADLVLARDVISMKQVASAVGEGGMSVYFVHRYLATV